MPTPPSKLNLAAHAHAAPAEESKKKKKKKTHSSIAAPTFRPTGHVVDWGGGASHSQATGWPARPLTKPRGGRHGHRSRPRGGPRSHSQPRSVAAPATPWPGSGRAGHPYWGGLRPPHGWGCSPATPAPPLVAALVAKLLTPLAAMVWCFVLTLSLCIFS
jgi:hypothetical protein